MPVATNVLITNGFKIHNKYNYAELNEKVELIAFSFSKISTFLDAKKVDFEKIVFHFDNPDYCLNESEYQKIYSFQKCGLLSGKLNNNKNLINIFIINFLEKHRENIKKIKFESEETHCNVAYYTVLDNVIVSFAFLVHQILELSNNNNFEKLDSISKYKITTKILNQIVPYLETNDNKNIFYKMSINQRYILNILCKNDAFIETQLFDILIFDKFVLELFTSLLNLIL